MFTKQSHDSRFEPNALRAHSWLNATSYSKQGQSTKPAELWSGPIWLADGSLMMYRTRSREGSLLEERRSPCPYRVCSWPLGSPGCQITSLQSPALTLADTGQASAPSPAKACCHLKQISRHRPPQHKKKPQHVLLYVAIVFSAHL